MPDLQDPLQPFVDAITPVIRDEQQWLEVEEIDRFIEQTLLQRYSKDNPLVNVSDIPGNGTAFLPLPVAFPGQAAVAGPPAVAAIPPAYGTFDPQFSFITQIEWPVGLIPMETIRQEDWNIYRSPTGYQLQVLSFVPMVGDIIRVTWTCQHAPDGSTIYQGDFYAICDFAASLCLQSMASRAAQFGDSTIGADTVNYRAKSAEYLTLAKEMRRKYFNHFGVNEGDKGEAQDSPAISTGSLHNIMGSAGVDRLVHSRYTR
jgi:hypothetical protein